MSGQQLVRVVAPHFVAGLVIDAAGRRISGAPILGWAIGKERAELSSYFRGRGWRASIIRAAEGGDV